MSGAAPSAKNLKKMLPKLGLGIEPFDRNQDMFLDHLQAYTDAIYANDMQKGKRNYRQLLELIGHIADGNVPQAHLAKIRKRILGLGQQVAKQRDKDLAAAKSAEDDSEEQDGLTGTNTIMSKMDARQQKDHFQKALRRAAEQKANEDSSGALETLRYLAYEVKGSLMYQKYGFTELDKMANDIWGKMVFDRKDAPRVNLEMVGKMKWPAFFKTYDVVHGDGLKPTFVTLAKILVKEGPSSTKPLSSAKAAFNVMKKEKTLGKFKSPQHLLGAVTDALLRNGGTVKLIGEQKAKELIAS